MTEITVDELYHRLINSDGWLIHAEFGETCGFSWEDSPWDGAPEGGRLCLRVDERWDEQFEDSTHRVFIGERGSVLVYAREGVGDDDPAIASFHYVEATELPVCDGFGDSIVKIPPGYTRRSLGDFQALVARGGGYLIVERENEEVLYVVASLVPCQNHVGITYRDADGLPVSYDLTENTVLYGASEGRLWMCFPETPGSAVQLFCRWVVYGQV